MRPLRRFTVPAVLHTVLLGACAAPVTPVDASMDAPVDTAPAPFPTSCDAMYPGRMCFNSCVYEGTNMPQSCVVFCAPIPSGGLFGVCNSNNPEYLCRLTAEDGGGNYVECLTYS